MHACSTRLNQKENAEKGLTYILQVGHIHTWFLLVQSHSHSGCDIQQLSRAQQLCVYSHPLQKQTQKLSFIKSQSLCYLHTNIPPQTFTACFSTHSADLLIYRQLSKYIRTALSARISQCGYKKKYLVKFC